MSFKGFDRARKAHGTDEDVLFVYFKNDPDDAIRGQDRRSDEHEHQTVGQRSQT